MKFKGRVYIICPSSRPVTFAVMARPTSLVIPVCLNDELVEMQQKRKQKKEVK
jgi:hypothetical protein